MKIKPYFLQKVKVKIKMLSAAVMIGALRATIRISKYGPKKKH